MKIGIHQCEKDKSETARKVLERLPEWFGDRDARESYIRTSNQLDCVKATIDHQDVGFLALKMHYQLNAEVYLLGVVPEHHRRGVGKMLILMARDMARKRSAEILTVKTLSPASKDPFYAKTRAFYESVGFRPFEELSTLWSENNPCLMMVMPLGAGK